ncbi:MAG TPA: hypothetical protein VGR02_07915 [Thermoanaerobaculia bacterium]|jgi:hypothetical protein|nr:hypothetical protein [Thermoanaerobaculia bacterium]
MKLAGVVLAVLLISPRAVAAAPVLAPCGSAQAVAGVQPRVVHLGDYIYVSVCHLKDFMAEAEAREQTVTLYVNGIDTGNKATGIYDDSGMLQFVLDRTDKNKELWRLQLYNPLFEPTDRMTIGVGKGGDRPLPRVAGANTGVTLNKLWINWSTWIWLALLFTVVIGILLYAKRTDLLREGPALGGKLQPYSLARTQMAWWFVLIVTGYIFLWLITGDRDSIPPSLLALLGISAATALAAVAITSTTGRAAAMRKMIDAEVAATDASTVKIDEELIAAAQRIAEARAAGRPTSSLEALQATLLEKRVELDEFRVRLIEQLSGISSIVKSDGIWHDLVMDDKGAIALDRLQIVVWTVVLGGVFIATVVWDLSMPEFNGTLLALMGISSGTYIGFKLPGRT